MNEKPVPVDSITLLVNDLRRKFRFPLKSMTFYTHLLLSVVGGGGLGIWYVIIMSYHTGKWLLPNLSSALFTYFPAIVAIAVIELIQEKQPYMRSFGLFSAFCFLVLFLMSVLSDNIWQLAWSLSASVLAVLFWWGVSGEKSCFVDIVPENILPEDDQPLLKNKDQEWKS